MEPGAAPIDVSIVVVVYDMAREAPRTLHSLSRAYQRDLRNVAYEVIVVDNGSPDPLPESEVEMHGPEFRLIRLDSAPSSPCRAINTGVTAAQGDLIGVLIDGARIVTPGIIATALQAARSHPEPVVATLGWHLGPDVQSRSVLDGYSRSSEDALLEQIDWRRDGYRLFEVSSLAGSSKDGYFLPLAESNCVFLRAVTMDRLAGYDEGFTTPGGGLANLDFFRRACALPETDLVTLLGEGSFHQVHGGATTGDENGPPQYRFRDLMDEYVQLRGEEWSAWEGPVTYYGTVPPAALRFIAESAERAAERG